MKAIIMFTLLLSGWAFAEDDQSITGSDSLYFESHDTSPVMDSRSGWHAGTYKSEEMKVEIRFGHSQRIVKSNLQVIRNDGARYLVKFQERAWKSPHGYQLRGNYLVQFVTAWGLYHCTYPADLLVEFFDEGNFAEITISFPSWISVTTAGQCIGGPLTGETYEFQRTQS